MLQHTTTHRNALNRTAPHCNTLQHTTTHYNTLHCANSPWLSVLRSLPARSDACPDVLPQHTATHRNTPHHTATHRKTKQHTECVTLTCRKERRMSFCTATHCSTLQHIATRCTTLQHRATHRNTPQHTATHRNTLRCTSSPCPSMPRRLPARGDSCSPRAAAPRRHTQATQ